MSRRMCKRSGPGALRRRHGQAAGHAGKVVLTVNSSIYLFQNSLTILLVKQSIRYRGRCQIISSRTHFVRERYNACTDDLVHRKRRVKCDEGKPACSRCVKFGVNCDGYWARGSTSKSSALTWRRVILPKRTSIVPQICGIRPRPHSESDCSQGKPADTCEEGIQTSGVIALFPGMNALAVLKPAFPPPPPFLDIPGTERERRSFNFLRIQAKSQLSGFFDCEFWNRFALQSCHHEPAIRHAAIALGALYEQYQFGGPKAIKSQLSVDSFPVQHYLRAISLLLHGKAEKDETRTALIVCILFVSFEVSSNIFPAVPSSDLGYRILEDIMAQLCVTSTPGSKSCPS